MQFSRLILLLFCFLLAKNQLLEAQETAVADSLKNLLETAESEDRLDLLFQLIDLQSLDASDRLSYTKDAIQLASVLSDKERLVDAHTKRGLLLYQIDEFDDAISSFETAYQISEEINLPYGMANSLMRIGRVKDYRGNTAGAEDYYNQALEICSKNRLYKLEGYTLNYIGDIHRMASELDVAKEYYTRAREAAEKAEDPELMASIFSDEGQISYVQGDFEGAIGSWEKAAELYLEAEQLFDAGRMYINMSSACVERAEYDLALDYCEKALPIMEKLDSYAGLYAIKNNFAIVYFTQELFDKALEVQKDLLESSRQAGNKSHIANALNNIGNIYNRQAEDSLKSIFGINFQDSVREETSDKYLNLFNEALNYYNQAYQVFEEIGDNRGMATVTIGTGIIYVNSGKPDLALAPLEKAMELNKALNDNASLSRVYLLLGMVYLSFENNSTALNYLNDALELALEADVKEVAMQIYEKLSEVYEKENNMAKALEYHKNYFKLFESIFSEKRRQAIADMQVKYETAATEKENQLLQARSELSDAKLKQQRVILFITFFAIGVFILMMLQLIRQNNLKKKANQELAMKNALITEQKKEITDSIQYASRIQTAMLPPGDYVDSLMPERFIIYMPRDIVSGDYYYITEKEGKVICVAADCTGHGVPGAFMSMLGIAFFNEIISKQSELHTDEILGELRSHVIKSLHQTGKEGESQDGMDLALYILDPRSRKLEFSGANNSLLVYRNGELIEKKADKMPIGIHTRVKESFTRHSVDLKKGDMVYTFSDGYPDQFGGPSQKKFMIKNFKNLLMDIHMKSMEDQKRIMSDTLSEWMAEADQVDDILVIGVRI